MLNKEISFTLMQVITSVYNYLKPRILGMIIALLFLSVILVSVAFTNWPAADHLPQNIEDQSNIMGIGLLIFDDFVIAFELLALLLLSSLMGAMYLAKGDDN